MVLTRADAHTLRTGPQEVETATAGAIWTSLKNAGASLALPDLHGLFL